MGGKEAVVVTATAAGWEEVVDSAVEATAVARVAAADWAAAAGLVAGVGAAAG